MDILLVGFCELACKTMPQWEIGWTKLREVILPNFIFELFIYLFLVAKGSTLEPNISSYVRILFSIYSVSRWSVRISLHFSYSSNAVKSRDKTQSRTNPSPPKQATKTRKRPWKNVPFLRNSKEHIRETTLLFPDSNKRAIQKSKISNH